MISNIPAFTLHQAYQRDHADLLAAARVGTPLSAAEIIERRNPFIAILNNPEAWGTNDWWSRITINVKVH